MTKQSDNTQETKSKDSSWIWSLVSAIIVGFLTLLGQIIISPIVARSVKTEESILEQRYKAYDNAVNILQRRLASVPMTGKSVPEWYIPPEATPPTQVETNVAYTQLAIYGKSNTIAEQFYLAAVGDNKIEPADIFKFVSAARKELEVDEKGFTGIFHYIFIRPDRDNEQKDKQTK